MVGMKSTKAAKIERRARRISKRTRHRDDGLTLTPLGAGTFEPGLAEQIVAAFRGFDPTAPWPAIAPRIVPALKRVRHPYPAEMAPLHINVPPGVWTGFGIDMGPAFSHVTQALLDRWGIDHAALLATALDNLATLVRSEPPVVESLQVGGVELVAIQGQGWGSSLVLAPDLLRPLLGSAPRVLLTPVRNTLLALPDDVDGELMFDLWATITEGVHDELDVDPLRWTGSTVKLLADERTVGLPN
jgi:hypothetical protein